MIIENKYFEELGFEHKDALWNYPIIIGTEKQNLSCNPENGKTYIDGKLMAVSKNIEDVKNLYYVIKGEKINEVFTK